MFSILLKERSVSQCFPGERAARNTKNVLQEATRPRINCVVLIFGVFSVVQYIKKTLVWIGSRQSHLAFCIFTNMFFCGVFFGIFSDLSKEVWKCYLCVLRCWKEAALTTSHLSPVAEVDGNTYWRNPFNSLCNPRQLEEFIVMDIDIVRDQKLRAGAGTRSSRVCISVMRFRRWVSGCPLLYPSSLFALLCVPAHPGWGVGSEDIWDGHQSTVSLSYVPGPPAQHRRPGAGVSAHTFAPLVKFLFL